MMSDTPCFVDALHPTTIEGEIPLALTETHPTVFEIPHSLIDNGGFSLLTLLKPPQKQNFIVSEGGILSNLPSISHCFGKLREGLVSLTSYVPNLRVFGFCAEWFLKKAKFLIPAVLSLTALACVSYFLIKYYGLCMRRYKIFNPAPPNLPQGHRPQPNLPQVGVINPNPFFHNLDQYNGSKVEEAKKLVRKNELLLLEHQTKAAMECKCGHAYANCTCAGFAPGEKVVLEQTRLALEVSKNNLELRVLAEFESLAYSVGSQFSFDLEEYGEFWFLKPFGVFRAEYTIVSHFETADNRPSTEKHISVSNTRFYVVRCTRLCFKTKIGGFFKHNIGVNQGLLWSLNWIGRDLVVAEEHMRLTRRASLSNNFANALKSQLECSMGVPINDPTFLIQKTNVIPDAFNLLCSMRRGKLCAYKDVFQ